MKFVRYSIVMLIFLLFAEGLVRFTGIYKTYSEANFGTYTSLYEKEEDTYYFKKRQDSINYHQTEFQYSCPTNSLGLREYKPFVADTSKNYKVLVLGDSFTEGVGGSCGHNMPDELQKLVADSVQIYNAGVVGADPFYSTFWYEKEFNKLDPEEVVFVVNYSDISDYIFRGGDERFHPDGYSRYKLAPSIEKYYKLSHLVRFSAHFVFGYDFTLLPPKEFENLSLEALDAIATEINTWSEKYPDKKVTVVLHPYPFSYAKDVKGHDILPFLELKLNFDIECIDLYSSFEEHVNKDNYLDYAWELDGHFNDQGYALFAKLIKENWSTTRAL